jgi:hypothetical protein
MSVADPNTVLNALYENAVSEGRPAKWLSPSELVLSLDVVSPDKSKTTFELIATINNNMLQFKEARPDILPAFCPNRHINSDGTFCLTAPWRRDELMTNPLALLQSFLRLQLCAGRDRKWPTKSEWAHGDAAVYQWNAESAAARLSPEWYKFLIGNNPILREKGNFVSLLGPQKRIAIWQKENRVATLRQRCFCGQSTRTVLECGSHANDAVEMITSLSLKQKAEADFWKALKGHSCCGSMKICPLRSEGVSYE